MSTIYAVSDPKTSQVYALKHVIPSDEKHLRFIQQLENEAAVSKFFRHPGLRKTFEFKTKRKLFGGISEAILVMELIDGRPLDQHRPYEVPEIVGVFQKVGVALAALHHLRYVHCDIKPNNILLTADNKVKVIDFGQTCINGTVKERVQGTPDFIAPEQVRCKPIEYYTDVYNFGATLYWALTSHRVPTVLTIKKGEKHVIKEQTFPKPHELNPAVPQPLGELAMDCVRLSPAYRPQSIGEVLDRMAPFGPPKGNG